MIKISYCLSISLFMMTNQGFSSYAQSCVISYDLPDKEVTPFSISVSSNGAWLAVGSSSRGTVDDAHPEIALFNIINGTLNNTGAFSLPGTGLQIVGVSLSPDGKYAAAVHSVDDYSIDYVLMFEIMNGIFSEPAQYSLPTDSINPNSVAFSPNGQYLAITNENLKVGALTIFNVNSNGTLSDGVSYDVPLESVGPSSAAFSPDGNQVVTANFSDDITLFTFNQDGTLNNKVTYSLPPGSKRPHAVVFSFSGRLIATANSLSHDVSLFVVNSHGVVSNGTSYDLPARRGSPWALAFSPNEKYLITANAFQSTVTVFRVNANETLSNATNYRISSKKEAPLVIAFFPSGEYFATGNSISSNSSAGDITILKMACLKSL